MQAIKQASAALVYRKTFGNHGPWQDGVYCLKPGAKAQAKFAAALDSPRLMLEN